MKISFSKSVDLRLLLNEIKTITTIKKGKVSYDAFRIYELKSILESHIKFPENLSNQSKQSIIQKTIRTVAIKGFDDKEFKRILNKEVKRHFNKKEQFFFLLTSLSISYLPFRKIKINNSEITIKGKHYPNSFNKNRNDLLKKKRENVLNDNFLKVIVKTKGKNYTDVFKESLKDLDVFRAILNLLINPNMQINFGSDEKPINRIRLGKFLTMHNEDGTTVNEHNYWWEPNFNDKIWELKSEKKDYIKNSINWYIKRINLSNKKFNQSICYSLGLYVNAFDQANKQTCFLKVWTSLETLLSTHQNETIIKRCLTVYNDESKPLQKQILEALKNYRNDFVHEGIEASKENLSTYCHRIQTNILYILRFNHLNYYSLFKNIEDANTFLDKRRLAINVQNSELEMFQTIRKKINTKN